MEKSKNGKCLGYRPTPGAPYKFLCFADVFKRSREIGSALIKHCNIKPGNDTKIGIYAKNSTEWFITCLGAVRYSMVTVPLYDTLGADAASYIVQQTKIKYNRNLIIFFNKKIQFIELLLLIRLIKSKNCWIQRIICHHFLI